MRWMVWIMLLCSTLQAQQIPVAPATPVAPSALVSGGAPVSGDAPVGPFTLGQTESRPFTLISPSAQPAVTPGQIVLMELEGRFQGEVATGGGKAFSSWFADDGVALNNGKPAMLGRGAIAASAMWTAAEYQLNWTPQGAQMGPSNDMGFTWGHYESRYKRQDGQTQTTSGRYITVWKKLPGQPWKVALDASADDVPLAECCAVPKP